MSTQHILDLFQESLITCALVAAPFLVAALAVGIVTSLLQAATQLQDNVLSFVPKIIAVALVLLLLGPWVLERLSRQTRSSITSTIDLARDVSR